MKDVKVSVSSTKQMYCSCDHEYQDEKYGRGKRLFNYAKKDDGWRCTICGSKKK